MTGRSDSEALCTAYLAAIEVVHGVEIAAASRCDYRGGWYYVHVAQRFPDNSIGRLGLATAYRQRDIESRIQELQQRGKQG